GCPANPACCGPGEGWSVMCCPIYGIFPPKDQTLSALACCVRYSCLSANRFCIQRRRLATARSMSVSRAQCGAVTCRPLSLMVSPMVRRRERFRMNGMDWPAASTVRQSASGVRFNGDDSGGANSSSCWLGGFIVAFRVELAHLILNPILNLTVQRVGAQSIRVNGRSDGDGNQSGFFHKGMPWPVFAGIMCYGDDRRTGADSQPGPTGPVASGLAWRNAGAFRKEQGPAAFFQSFAAYTHHLFEGIPSS